MISFPVLDTIYFIRIFKFVYTLLIKVFCEVVRLYNNLFVEAFLNHDASMCLVFGL